MRRLKILLAVMIIFLAFLLGYSGHGEDLEALQVPPVSTGTGAVITGTVANDETIIYTREDTERNIAEKINSLIGDYNISYTIVHECSMQTKDYKLCIKNVLGVANAESGMFKKGMYPSNNGFGWMYKGHKRRFPSVEESIKQWVSMYVRNGWSKRTTGEDWLKGKYCTSECSHRVKNYNYAVNKLKKLELI